jgi:hypothetical protein
MVRGLIPSARLPRDRGRRGFGIAVEKLEDRRLLAEDFLWAGSWGGADAEIGWDVAVDTAGTVYTTGAFFGTVDFDPGAGVVSLNQCRWAGHFCHEDQLHGEAVLGGEYGRPWRGE